MVLLLLLWLHHGDPVRVCPRSIQDNRRNNRDVQHHDKDDAALSMPTAAAMIDDADDATMPLVVILVSSRLVSSRLILSFVVVAAEFAARWQNSDTKLRVSSPPDRFLPPTEMTATAKSMPNGGISSNNSRVGGCSPHTDDDDDAASTTTMQHGDVFAMQLP